MLFSFIRPGIVGLLILFPMPGYGQAGVSISVRGIVQSESLIVPG